MTRGQYDVRLRRTSPELSVQEVSDVAHWTALRSITTRDPVVPTGLAEVAVRIKATDQLNGILDQYNCVAQTVAKAWNGAAWVEQATSQPGALFRHVLQGNALSAEYRPADAKIALTDLADWDDANIAAGREFNAVIDFATTVEDTLRDICAAGRAALSPNRDGQYSVVRDVEQTVPIQHFSPRNSWGFVGRKAFPDTPHALKVRFPNRDKDWTADERTVYDDGYDSTNATKFEVLELFGITDPVQVWRDGRYHIATARLRPETYELNVDVEHLVATRGDLVKVSHDVALFGIGSARVKSVTLDGSSNATAVTIDDAMPMEAGKSYSARFRKSDGASVLAAVDTVDGDNTVLTFATPIAAASPQPVAGDLMLFGETGSESVDLIVKEIQHAGDLAARLVLVDHAPAVHDADQGDIPAFDSQITVPPEINAPAPAKPKILDVLSGEDVLERDMAGTLQSRIVMVLDQRSSGAVPAVHLEPQFRRSATGAPWEKLPVLPPAATEASFAPVEDGAGYDVRIRAVGRYGATSAWAVRENHTVIGKTTPPPDVDAVYIEQMDDGAGRARFPYADPPVDFAGFRVKANVGLRDAWETGWLLHGEKELVKDPFFDLTMLNGLGQRVVMVKAVDVAGNESTNAARALLNAGDIPAGTIVDTIDHAALGWPGALTGGAVDGGAVKADDDGGLFWSGADAEPFWTGDTTQTFWATTYVQMVYLATVTPGHNDPRYRLGINATVAAPSWKAEYRRPLSASPFWYGDDARMFWQDDGDAFWTGLGEDGPFVPWPGSIKAGAEPIDIRVTTAPGTPRGVVSALSFTLGLDS